MKTVDRIIRAGFWFDAIMLGLPRDVRLFFVGLWMVAEASGCLENEPLTIRCALFANDPDVTPLLVTEWITTLVDLGRLVTYEVEGKPYLYIRNFHKHQDLRSVGRPSVPLPPWIRYEPSSKYRTSGHYRLLPPYGDGTVIVGSSNGDEEKRSELNKNEGEGEESDATSPGDDEPGCLSVFSLFWALYPNKERRQEALVAWNTLMRLPVAQRPTPQDICWAAKLYHDQKRKDGTPERYFQLAVTFLDVKTRPFESWTPQARKYPVPTEWPSESSRDSTITNYTRPTIVR